MIEFLSLSWEWYVAGPMISLIMFLLLWAGGNFGVSSTLRTACSIAGAGNKVSFFNFNWKNQIWNLVFVLGAIIGGYIANRFLSSSTGMELSIDTIEDLKLLGIEFEGKMLPESIFSWKNVNDFKSYIVVVLGSFLVGFGARWAGGCTSGHAISGLSNLQIPSLIAVIGFFIGGLIMTHFLFPFIFNL